MKRNIYFTADWHSFHDNILHYCNRPFKNTDGMHKKIVTEFNKKVNKNDITYFLGDMGFYGFENLKELINSLNGIKILVLGNHDKWGVTSYYNCGFSAVVCDATIKVGKRQVYLNHIPRRAPIEFFRLCKVYVREMKRRKRTWRQVFGRIKNEWKRYKRANKNWTFCGHVHTAWKVRGKNINVGVDQWDFKPVGIRELISIMDKEDK